MRVLVAEDEPLLADTVAEGLRRWSVAVDVCYDGDAADCISHGGGAGLGLSIVAPSPSRTAVPSRPGHAQKAG